MRAAQELASLGVEVAESWISRNGEKRLLADVRAVGYLASDTIRYAGNMVSGYSSQARCRIIFDSGSAWTFRATSKRRHADPKQVVAPVWLLQELVSELTFERRLERYLTDLKKLGFVELGEFQLHQSKNIYRRTIHTGVLPDPSKVTLQPFSVVFETAGRATSLPLQLNRDCALYVLRHHFGYYWEGIEYRRPHSIRQRSFFVALVRLGAKLAKADGVVSPDEIRHFKSYFNPDAFPIEDVAALFREAVADSRPIGESARELADNSDPAALESILIGLIGIAAADGRLDQGEANALVEVGHAFGLASDHVNRLIKIHADFGGAEFRDSAHRRAGIRLKEKEAAAHLNVLGLQIGASREEIKTIYRTLVSAYHPDILRSKGLPEKLITVASETLVSVNAAYEWLRRNGYV